MGLFERIRSGGNAVAIARRGEADPSEQDAVRLIDEGNAIEGEGRMEQALQRYEAAIHLAPKLARAHLNRGNVLLEMGDTDGALGAYATALVHDPNYAAAPYNMGNAYLRSGRREAAVAAYRKAIGLKPDFADAEVALGGVLEDLGQLDAAVASYRRALKINPNYAEVHSNLGNTLRTLGQVESAAASYRRALEIKPDFVVAHCNLGDALQSLRKHCDAVASYRRALQLAPGFAQAHCNLGISLQNLGQLDEALASYHRALELNPNFAEAYNNLGNILQEIGQLDDSVASYRSALEINPSYADAHCNLGSALRDVGQTGDAVVSFRRALEIAPDFAEAHSNLGNALKDLGRAEDALASYRRALKIKPDFAKAHSNLGSTLKDLGQLDEAVASFRRALQINPDYTEAHNNLGTALQDLGQLDAAVASYRLALEIKPDFAMANSNVLFCLSHDETISSQALFAEHCRFGEQFEAPLRASWPQHRNVRDPTRCLQLGFVSGDLRDHAVAYFVEPLLAQLAGKPALSLHAYYNHASEGGATPRLRGYVKHWHPIVRLPDAALAQKIGEDGIDILIDLSGHTADNRLLTFARKPAPVQASWMGYPGTTGLSAMDYYLADRYFLPPANKFDDQFTEKLVYLPAIAPFLPDDRAPPVNALPALSNGYVTFGSFNRPSKLSRSAVALWSRVLRALPDTRMLLGGMLQEGQCGALIDWFAREGIARERLSFYPRSDPAAYLALHHLVDMCLDTFPYTGGTTTNHALWMGVPTLTLAGPTPPGRHGAAIMGHVRLNGFVAEDIEDFQKKGLAWARNPAGLAEVRAGLRERFEQSPVRRPEVIAAGLEKALRTMWERWCAGLPAEAFEVNLQTISGA